MSSKAEGNCFVRLYLVTVVLWVQYSQYANMLSSYYVENNIPQSSLTS